MGQSNLAPKRCSQKFSKLNWEKIAEIRLLKSKKYGNWKIFLDIIATTITQLNSLFVLYYWSSYCKRLIKLLMKCAQFINNYQKSTLGGPMVKQFVLQSCFLCIPRHTNIMTGKGFNLFYGCTARCVYYGKKSAPLLPEGTVKCTHLEA